MVRYSQAFIGSAPLLLCSHWSRDSYFHGVATPALLYHKEPAQGTQSLLLGGISCLSLVLYGIRIGGIHEGEESIVAIKPGYISRVPSNLLLHLWQRENTQPNYFTLQQQPGLLVSSVLNQNYTPLPPSPSIIWTT